MAHDDDQSQGSRGRDDMPEDSGGGLGAGGHGRSYLTTGTLDASGSGSGAGVSEEEGRLVRRMGIDPEPTPFDVSEAEPLAPEGSSDLGTGADPITHPEVLVDRE